ncbi:MAG TPA: glycosyltransferase [Thermoleophilaceae bacterium]|nr:glycosyltransferase [Thermoleophilaceae bacterium]
MSMRIAAAISTHNRRETALLALQSALAQTHPPVAVFMVCDGCDDGTQDAARALGDPRVVVLDKPKAPGAGWVNRNDVLEQAEAEVVAWLSDDDLWLPDHLERVVPLYEGGVADLVQSSCVLVEADGSMYGHGLDWSVARFRQGALEKGRHETPSSAMSHTIELGLRAGGWRTVDRYGDKDFWHRMLRAGARTSMLTEPTVLFFRAWERHQPYEDRVRQNSAFLERIRNPAELPRLRAEMARAVHERQATVDEQIEELKLRIGDLESEAEWLRGERERLLEKPAPRRRLRRS